MSQRHTCAPLVKAMKAYRSAIAKLLARSARSGGKRFEADGKRLPLRKFMSKQIPGEQGLHLFGDAQVQTLCWDNDRSGTSPEAFRASQSMCCCRLH